MLDVIYADLCDSCNGDLSSEEINSGLCFKRDVHLCQFKYEYLYKEFVEFFEKAIGKLREIQRFWAKRVLNGESFAAVAPTGIGKTSFGVVMSLFMALRGKKSYIILPTTLLVKQVVENIQNYAKKLGLDLNINVDNSKSKITILYYHGKLKRDEKDSFFKLLKEDYDILITTTQFLAKHFEDINKTFDFIFVDDVDAILKASRNVDRILILLGFKKVGNRWEGKAKGCLMVSTATAKKGQKVQLFRQLLNFDVGSTTHAIRNIEDIVIESDKANINTLYEIMVKMGDGGIVFARSNDEAEEIYRELLKLNLRVGIVKSGKTKDFGLFEKGEIDYLIGTAYYYGALVRGLDLPERIRFVIFYGAPVFNVKIDDIDSAPIGIIKTLALIFKEEEEVKPFIQILPSIEKKTEELTKLKDVLKTILARKKISGRDVVLRENEIVFPDIRTYIQGSGRTSRLFAGGITKGASFLLEKDPDVLSAFVERAKFYEIEFKNIEDVDFEKLKKEIDESRDRYRKRSEFDVIKPTLFVVESPTKAKQIARFFGQPSIKVLTANSSTIIAYEVPTPERVLIITASLGHITDLITNRGFYGVYVNGGNRFTPIYASIKRCKVCGYQFTEKHEICPRCEGEVDDSKSRIAMLRKLAKETGFVIIGTDPDSEGEKIAWDIKNLLSGCAEIKRAEFHEVTKRALMKALSNLRDVDEKLVKAQLVRRIEDRWIGFTLSQKLWRVFHDTNLSAGRAQTPVLGWIIERAEENKRRKKVAVIKEFNLYLEDFDIKAIDKGDDEVELEISIIDEKVDERLPLPPYTTDTMLRDANTILKLSAKEVMQIAQDLFERGLITYHRTDSTHVSEVGLRIAKDYLGEDYHGRSWSAEGTHECIRPTRAIDKDLLERLIHEGVIQAEDLKWTHLALYDLIFRRFMASQCKNYIVKEAKYKIIVNGKEYIEERVVEASGKAHQLYRWGVWVKNKLPIGKFKVKVEIRNVPKAPLYTQSDVIQLMKERKIGRPSTYATILDRLFIRNYVGERNKRIYPTKRGIEVFEFLRDNYNSFVSEERTRLLEEKMDAVERGELEYIDALKELYEEIARIQ